MGYVEDFVGENELGLTPKQIKKLGEIYERKDLFMKFPDISEYLPSYEFRLRDDAFNYSTYKSSLCDDGSILKFLQKWFELFEKTLSINVKSIDEKSFEWQGFYRYEEGKHLHDEADSDAAVIHADECDIEIVKKWHYQYRDISDYDNLADYIQSITDKLYDKDFIRIVYTGKNNKKLYFEFDHISWVPIPNFEKGERPRWALLMSLDNPNEADVILYTEYCNLNDLLSKPFIIREMIPAFSEMLNAFLSCLARWREGIRIQNEEKEKQQKIKNNKNQINNHIKKLKEKSEFLDDL